MRTTVRKGSQSLSGEGESLCNKKTLQRTASTTPTNTVDLTAGFRPTTNAHYNSNYSKHLHTRKHKKGTMYDVTAAAAAEVRQVRR